MIARSFQQCDAEVQRKNGEPQETDDGLRCNSVLCVFVADLTFTVAVHWGPLVMTFNLRGDYG